MSRFSIRIATVNLNGIVCKAKQSLVRDFVNLNDIDIVFFQEMSMTSTSFLPGHDVILSYTNSCRSTAVAIRKNFVYSDMLVDPSGRIISFIVNGVNFVNVYAQSGSQYKKERNDFFTESIAIHLNKHFDSLVIGGDFNCVLSENDCRGANNFCQGLQQLIDKMKLKDVAKHKIKKPVFTFFRGNSASRLDRFYFSANLVDKVYDVQTVPLAFSDHHSVIVKIEVDKLPPAAFTKPAYWKLNSAILKNEALISDYVHKINQC